MKPFFEEAKASEQYELLLGFEKDAVYCADFDKYLQNFPTPDARYTYLINRLNLISERTEKSDYDELVKQLGNKPEPIVYISGVSPLDECLASQAAYAARYKYHHNRTRFLKNELKTQQKQEQDSLDIHRYWQERSGEDDVENWR